MYTHKHNLYTARARRAGEVKNQSEYHQKVPLFQHRDTQETLAVLDRLDLDTEKPTDEEVARKFGFEEDYLKGTVSWWQHLKPQMWSLFDEPYSSNAAKVRLQ